MEAYYYLGNSYEQLQELDKARSAYQVAVLGNLTQAFNNLAHLYIVEDEDYSAAAALLMQGLQQNIDNDQIRAILLKNLGWARLGQKRYSEAQGNLEEAIHLNDQQASPHCLLAQVLEAQGKKAIALTHWQNCSDYANGQNSDEDRWFGLAQQRLNSVRD
ncbi:MAG: tetratricopeptide repeat protein [Crocosphaera sp.]|nr:tetratricopeptide repeat protein [Crocosphaera sp.]